MNNSLKGWIDFVTSVQRSDNMEKVLFDSEKLDFEMDLDEELSCLFDDSHQNNSYILVGTCGCWNGEQHIVFEEIYDSVYEAIKHTFIQSQEGFKVILGKYGKLNVITSHHDGVNDFEIRQLSDKGYEMHQNWWSISEIIRRKGTTKYAHFKESDMHGK